MLLLYGGIRRQSMEKQVSKDAHRDRTSIRPCIVDLSFIVIFNAKTSLWYALIIWLFFEICLEFSLLLFQKQTSKDHLAQRNLFKITLLNEKQSNLEEEIWKYLLILPIFSPGVGSNVQKIYFYFLKLTKKIFYCIFLDQKRPI